MNNIKMFEGDTRVDQTWFKAGSGADWMPQYKKYINNGKTSVSNPHKIYGPDSLLSHKVITSLCLYIDFVDLTQNRRLLKHETRVGK